jgi:hypothetical protein
MAENAATNGRASLVGWIAGPMVGTVLGVIVSEFKNVADHANRIGVLEASMLDLRQRVNGMDAKIDRLLEFHNAKR